jgi:GTP-binding protein
MSQYPEAHFIKSANAAKQFVADNGAEVAVAGRSNAGKSSAINVIVNRRQFARTSKTPGRTQLVNFFSLRDDHRLVDLPGYGFARVSDTMRNHWDRLLTDYFSDRQSLRGLFMIVDSRRQLQDYDRQMMAFAGELPIHILLTKADKLKRGQASSALLKVRKDVGNRATVQLFSSLRREGEAEAREVLERFLGDEKSRGGLRPGQ